MTLTKWEGFGWLKRHKTSKKEIFNVVNWLNQNHPELV